jgi:hypothetical protein
VAGRLSGAAWFALNLLDRAIVPLYWCWAGLAIALNASGIWHPDVAVVIFLYALTAVLFTAQHSARSKMSWLRSCEGEMVAAAIRKGKLEAMPSREAADGMRAMVMDPELDEQLRELLQPLARYLETMERLREDA